jgi:hypothetical protein
MNEIVALGIDDIKLCAGLDRRQDMRENPAHIDVENENAEWLAVRCENRSSNAQHRRAGVAPVDVIQLDRRDIDLPWRQSDRFLEIVSVAALLQFRIGDHANPAVGARPVDADDFSLIVVDADQPDHGVGGLGFQFRRKVHGDPLAPDASGNAVREIGAAGHSRADQSGKSGNVAVARDVAASPGRVRFKFGRYQPRMRLDAIEHARQQRLFQAAIIEPADGDDRDRNQEGHRDSQPGRERHPGEQAAVPHARALRQHARGHLGFSGGKRHRYLASVGPTVPLRQRGTPRVSPAKPPA